MLLNCGVGEDSWESLGLQGDPTSPSWRKSVLNIHWKDWCWSWNSNTLATDPDAGKDWRWEEKGTTEDEMVGWCHWLNGHGFGWTLGVGDGQGSLVCCSPWGRKSRTRLSDWTERPIIVAWTNVGFCLLSIAPFMCTCLSPVFSLERWRGHPDLQRGPSWTAWPNAPQESTGVWSLGSQGDQRLWVTRLDLFI